MKYLNKLSFLFILLVALSCKKDDIPPIGEPFDKVEGLTATGWIVEEAYLVDESNPAKPERDISEFYTTGDRLEVKFNADGTFEVTPGSGLNFFPASGTWAFDNNSTPTEIVLTDENMVETVAPLGGPTRISDPQLKINFIKRYCDDGGEQKAALGYRLVFNRKS
jgi:hypothetical protein